MKKSIQVKLSRRLGLVGSQPAACKGKGGPRESGGTWGKTLVFPQKKGSALLIAILVMGILMTLTLSLGELFVREIRQTHDVVAAGHAYFAAEAGIENALLDLHEHLAGFETPVTGVTSKTDDLNFTYKILNKADKIPYFEPDKPVFLKPGEPPYTSAALYSDNPAATYNVLPLSETVAIPLFRDDGKGNVVDVKDFIVEYYANFCGKNPDSAKMASCLTDIPVGIEKLDILRWKIFGQPKRLVTMKTDAISDFFPMAQNSTANNPVCFGTATDLDSACIFPVYVSGVPNFARECYSSDKNSSSSLSFNKNETQCSIADFISSHKQNYLVLTNVVNPDVIGISDVKYSKEKANIYYRIIAKNAPVGAPLLVREAALIRADGFADNGRIKKSIDAELSLNTFLPVFNFSLYQTK